MSPVSVRSRAAACARPAEYADDAVSDAPAFAIASTGGLGDLVEPGLGAPDAGEIEIDAGLDQRGGDQPAGLSVFQPLPNVARISRRCAAYWRVVRWTTPSRPAATALR